MPPSLPGGGLAPGALISIRGLRLGGGGAETRVVFRQNGVELPAELRTTSGEYLEARVPAGATAGAAELVVVHNGSSSRPFPIRIVPGATGIFATNGKGWGRAGNATQPGGHAAVTVTGMDGLRTAEVWVGGKPASGVMVEPVPGPAGREEVRFTLAPNTPLGCYVPVLIKTAAGVSNVVTLPVAAHGGQCPDSSGLGRPPDALLLLARLMMRVRLVGGAPADFTQDVGAAAFPGSAGVPLLTGWREMPPAGTCTAFSGNWIGESSSGGITSFLLQLAGAGGDAGAQISVSGPKGRAKLDPDPVRPGLYSAELGGGLPFTRYPKPRFLIEGLFRISASGGAQIGEFAAAARFDTPLKWRDPAKLDTIDRAKGALVRWSGAGSSKRVLVLAFNVDQLSGGMGTCLCVAPGEAGRMEIPPMMLANLPASGDIPGVPLNYVFIGSLPVSPLRVQARGVESGVILVTSLQGRTVTYR